MSGPDDDLFVPPDEDLSLPEGLEMEEPKRDPAPSSNGRMARTNLVDAGSIPAGAGSPSQRISPVVAPTGQQERFAPRGVGEVYLKAPIGCVVEILKRVPIGNGKWQIVPPFSKKNPDERWAFAIMSASTSTTIKRGNRDVPAREEHPQFKEFNTCEPEKASILRCRLVHFDLEQAYSFFLGAFQPPKGHGDTPPKGWWCRGDAKEAERWVNGAFRRIPCPGKLCEFQQEKWGMTGNQAHCKPNLTLVAQFNWNEKSTLPRMMFEFDSKSWNNHGAFMGMFELVKDVAKKVLEIDKFPVLQMPFTMTVKEQVKRNGRRFPSISVSIEGDPYEWMGRVRQLLASRQDMPAIEGPSNLRALPPPGMTQDDVDAAAAARLDPNYRPANQR